MQQNGPPAEERIGEIESLFPTSTSASLRRRSATRWRAEFLCECHDPACGARVVVPLDEFETVREEGTRFLHAAGHVESDFERVVACRPKYAIVEKFGRTLAAIVVRRLDPRAQPS